MDKEKYIKKSEIAEYLAFSTKTIERWVEAGCPCFTSPGGEQTFKISEVVEWANNRVTEKNK